MKKGLKFRTQYDPDYKGRHDSHTVGKSETVPDQGLTVRDLMERHTRGIGTTTREGVYLDEYGLEVPRIEDLTDIQAMREYLDDREKELMEQIKKEKEEKKKDRDLKDQSKHPQDSPDHPSGQSSGPPKEE